MAALLFDLFANLIDQCFFARPDRIHRLGSSKTTVVIVRCANGQTHTRVVLCGFGWADTAKVPPSMARMAMANGVCFMKGSVVCA